MKLALALVLLSHCSLSFAGICTSDPVAMDHKQDFQLYAGYSPSSATLIGTAQDRRFLLAGVSYGYRCWAWKSISISYRADLMPGAVVFQPAEFLLQGAYGSEVARFAPAHAVYGFGITPIGLMAEFARTRTVHPFLLGNAGVVASTEPIPEPVANATGLNFLFDFGGGSMEPWRETRDRLRISISSHLER